VIAMEWCSIDSSYLITCAKDSRTIRWDTVSGEIVSELPTGTNWNFDVHCRYGVGENEFGAAHLRAPKRYKRPVGFHPRPSAAGVPAGASEVYVHTLVIEDSLVSRSSEFEAAIQKGERLCLKMMGQQGQSCSPTKEKDSVEDLSHFEYGDDKEVNVTEKVGYGDDKEVIVFSTDNGEDFFNNLSPAGTPVSTSRGENFPIGDTAPDLEQLQQEPDGFEESTDPAFDDVVQSALIVGDYKGAVAQCISANKMADALVIAKVGGASLWESTRDQCFKISRSPYLKVVSAMVNNDPLSLVNTRPLKFWKETLAFLCSIEEWTMLCDTLASKLIAAGNTLAATLCYICAGNIDKKVEIWSRSLRTKHEGKSYVELLQDLMEKTIVLALATGQK
ncbi:protein transport protein sec31 like protein b, partial [Quercus suber]